MNIEAWLAITIPIATGIVFIAYRHPVAYRENFFPAISVTGAAIMILALAYNIGVMQAGESVRAYAQTIEYADRDNNYASAAQDSYIPGLFFLVVGVSVWFFQFLTTLPKWLDIKDISQSDTDDKDPT